MTDSVQKELDKNFRVIVREFINTGENDPEDTVLSSLLAIITQFILNFRKSFHNICENAEYVLPEQIIELEIQELRRCIVDLERCKSGLIDGVTKQ